MRLRKGAFEGSDIMQSAYKWPTRCRSPLWVCEGTLDALALLAAGIPRVVAIYGVQGWCWVGHSTSDVFVFALDADVAGQQQWQALARQAALRGKRVAGCRQRRMEGAKM